MNLCLAISEEHRLVTDKQTHDDGTYCISMALRGKNASTSENFKNGHFN